MPTIKPTTGASLDHPALAPLLAWPCTIQRTTHSYVLRWEPPAAISPNEYSALAGMADQLRQVERLVETHDIVLVTTVSLARDPHRTRKPVAVSAPDADRAAVTEAVIAAAREARVALVQLQDALRDYDALTAARVAAMEKE